MPRYVVIANPESLRWRAYEPELRAFWRERGTDPEVEAVPWREVVAREGDLGGLPAFERPAVVRLESPGRDWDVARRLLALGARQAGEDAAGFHHCEYRKGWLLRPGLFYLGFRRTLEGLKRSFDARPHLHLTACPVEVAEMFDKNATSARLAAAGIPVPPSVEPPRTSHELLDELRRRRFGVAYVKQNSGSSASAIAVVRALADEPRAVSSVLAREDGFYSSRRLVWYQGEGLHTVLTFLLDEGACVQQGIRMAQLEGQNFDVRVVVIHGEPAFTIFRLSNQPMTNLHLGGRRGDVRTCRAGIPVRAWLDAIDHCVETARLYRSAAVGIDLLFESGYARHFVLEVNAFGDFFPNLVDERGRSVHRVEIEETARRAGLG